MKVVGSTLEVTAAPGDANNLSVARWVTDGDYHVTDSAADLTAGPGCSPDTGNPSRHVICPAAGVTDLTVDAGDRDDSVSIWTGNANTNSAGIPAVVDAGDGNDTVSGGSNGWGEPDFFDGGDGNDNLSGGDDDDELIGGPGNDQLTDDVVDGSGAPANRQGDDIMRGGPGEDFLVGQGHGDDLLQGGDGLDQLISGPGDDTLEGGGDADIYHSFYIGQDAPDGADTIHDSGGDPVPGHGWASLRGCR